jgi:hypothetical protein
MTKFYHGQKVCYTQRGVAVEGSIVDGPAWFYPNSTVTKYGGGSLGQAEWGYRVRGPIVLPNGTIYSDRDGRMLPGIGYIPAHDLTQK